MFCHGTFCETGKVDAEKCLSKQKMFFDAREISKKTDRSGKNIPGSGKNTGNGKNGNGTRPKWKHEMGSFRSGKNPQLRFFSCSEPALGFLQSMRGLQETSHGISTIENT